jgi:hypothetical protein
MSSETGSVVDARPVAADMTQVGNKQPPLADADQEVDLAPAGTPDALPVSDLARDANTTDVGISKGQDGAAADVGSAETDGSRDTGDADTLRDAGSTETRDARCAAALCVGGGICGGSGPTAGLPCPILGTTASACGYCPGNNSIFSCYYGHYECAPGVTCVAPDCVWDPCCGPAPP